MQLYSRMGKQKLRDRLILQSLLLIDISQIWLTDISFLKWWWLVLDIDECQRYSPCQHNGTCVNNRGAYSCECKAGWEGFHCENGKYLLHDLETVYSYIGKYKGECFVCDVRWFHNLSLNKNVCCFPGDLRQQN